MSSEGGRRASSPAGLGDRHQAAQRSSWVQGKQQSRAEREDTRQGSCTD